MGCFSIFSKYCHIWTVILSNAAWLKMFVKGSMQWEKVNSNHCVNIFPVTELICEIHIKVARICMVLNFLRDPLSEASSYWNNLRLQHPVQWQQSAVFEPLIVQFKVAFSEVFQVFHLEEMPLAHFSILPGSIFFTRAQVAQTFSILFLKVSYFMFNFPPKKKLYMQKKLHIDIYLFSSCGEQRLWNSGVIWFQSIKINFVGNMINAMWADGLMHQRHSTWDFSRELRVSKINCSISQCFWDKASH